MPGFKELYFSLSKKILNDRLLLASTSELRNSIMPERDFKKLIEETEDEKKIGTGL